MSHSSTPGDNSSWVIHVLSYELSQALRYVMTVYLFSSEYQRIGNEIFLFRVTGPCSSWNVIKPLVDVQ